MARTVASGDEPRPLDMMKMMCVALSDVRPRHSDAMFLFGIPATEDHLIRSFLASAATQWHKGFVDRLAINGLTAKECKRDHQGYCGVEKYLDILLEFGVDRGRIEIIEPAPHTAAESRNFLSLAFSRRWGRLVVSSLPHHQLRCFLQVIALMKRPYSLKVYNAPSTGVSLMSKMTKLVANAGHESGWQDVSGAYEEHINEEYKRILAYAAEPPVQNGRPKYNRHATLPEALAYVRWRDDEPMILK